MAERNEQVMEMVRRELEQKPDTATGRLYRMAQEIDPAVSELSLRQFNARYPLQAKRRRPRAQGGGARKRSAKRSAGGTEPGARARKSRSPAAGRDPIRKVFLQFASDFAQAESRSEIVQVLSNVDDYVERVERLIEQR